MLRTLDKGGNLENVRGIVYRNGEQIRKTEPRLVVENLDDIPFPSYEGLGLEEYFENEKNYDSSALFDYTYTEEPRVLPMFLGRSCPFGCRFCFHTTGRRYRNRSLDNFFQELDMWIEKYKINGILLMDELFGGSEKTILDFCERIKDYHIPWVAEIRVELASKKVLKAMKDSGCSYLQFGLESMSEYVLKDMNKKIHPEQIQQALKDAYDLKIHVFGNFIFGAEAENQKSFLTTYGWWNRHRKYQIRLLNIMLYPGSEYYKDSLERGIIGDKERFIEEGMPVVNFSRMSEFEWSRMRRVIRMTNTDNVFFGRITKVQEEEDVLTLDIRCCHCKKIFTVEQVKKENRYKGTDMLSLCPHCGRNNRYNFDDFKDIMTHEVMSQWIENQTEGVTVKNWLNKTRYKRIGLWGNSLLSELFAKNINDKVEIVYLSGSNTNRMSAYNYLGSHFLIVEPENLNNYEIDALIVTDVSEYVSSVDFIRDSGYVGTIDSLVNFIFDMEYHLVISAGKTREEIMEADD